MRLATCREELHAQKRAYEIADDIRFDGMQYRRDIGYRAIRR